MKKKFKEVREKDKVLLKEIENFIKENQYSNYMQTIE